MSSSPSKLVEQDEEAEEAKSRTPEWLEGFLQTAFFDPCEDHPIRRNEKNRYCIDCHLASCQYCMSSSTHRHHQIFKVYRHIYKEVVSLSAMEKYIDCTGIQSYKCNKQQVIALNPLPHSGPVMNNDISCRSCNRRLYEPDINRYCCISCKVRAAERTSNDLAPSPPSIQPPPEEEDNQVTIPEKPQRRRKGNPLRAPFF